LFDNLVGYRTSLAKCSAFCCFLSEFVQKLKFLNNSIEERVVVKKLKKEPYPALSEGPGCIFISQRVVTGLLRFFKIGHVKKPLEY
jgi:hypothetical protein